MNNISRMESEKQCMLVIAIWEKSCGASREYGYALEAGKQIMMEELHE